MVPCICGWHVEICVNGAGGEKFVRCAPLCWRNGAGEFEKIVYALLDHEKHVEMEQNAVCGAGGGGKNAYAHRVEGKMPIPTERRKEYLCSRREKEGLCPWRRRIDGYGENSCSVSAVTDGGHFLFE